MANKDELALCLFYTNNKALARSKWASLLAQGGNIPRDQKESIKANLEF